MAIHKKSQNQRKKNNLITNDQQKVCELVISNFLIMNGSTLEVPVQKNQLTIAATQFGKARDTLNAHIKISIKEKSIVLEKDNALTIVDIKKDKYPQSTKVSSKEKMTSKPKRIKDKSERNSIIQLSEVPPQNQCEEIISKFLATKITETRTAIIQQFAAAGIPVANTNTQTQTKNNCTVQSIEIPFSEDSKRPAILAFIKTRDALKAQIKVRFSKQGIILIKVKNSTKTLKVN